MKRHNSDSRLRPRTIVAGLFLLLAAVLLRLTLREKVPVLAAADLQALNASAGEIMGRHLAGRFPGGRVLIVVRPGVETGQGTAEEKSLLEGFQKAVAGHMQIAGTVAPQVPDWFREQLRGKIASGEVMERDTGLMLSATTMWYETQGLADMIRTQPQPVSVIVSITALPADFPGRPEVAAALPPMALLLAPALNMGRLLDSGRVEAVVAFKPPGDWTAVDAPGSDAGKAFNSRYLLVHAGNRDEMQRLHPGLFR